jgi:hypothetical protein
MTMLDHPGAAASLHSTLPVAEFVWLLLLASVTTVAVSWIPIPHTVALVLVGLVVSGAGLLSGVHPTGDVILLVFLPPLLFQAALEVDTAPPVTGGAKRVLSDHQEMTVHFTCEGARLAGTLTLPTAQVRILPWCGCMGLEQVPAWSTAARPWFVPSSVPDSRC